MQVRRVGERALLVECADHGEVSAAYALLRSRESALSATEIVPASRTVLLDGLPDPVATAALIAEWSVPVGAGVPRGGLVEIPTTYDGVDLPEVARQWGMTTDEVIGTHRGTEFVVAFCGFVPGFAYCTGLPPELTVSRRAEPRVSVPTGSVALAGEYAGVYPRASPGGWQLIGSTPARLWDPARTAPALLEPGTRVRFVDG